MKHAFKILALILAMCMLLSVSAFASGEASEEAAGEAAVSEEEIKAAYADYIHEWLLAELEVNSTMTEAQVEDEFMPLVEAGDYETFPAEMLYSGMLTNGVAMTYDEFAAQYTPSAAVSEEEIKAAYVEYIHEFLLAELEVNSTMTEAQVEDEFMPLIEAGDYETFPADMLYSGMLNSGVAMTYDEFAAQYTPSGDTVSVEDAYVEYIHEFLLAELEVNSTMTEAQVEDEFMPLIEAGDYETFPADMLYSGMLNSGVAMTFDEFSAQYVPETTDASGEAGGDTSETAYQTYLKAYVDAVPAVSDEQYEEFAALIDAGDYVSFPVEMCFTDTYWGYTAMTYDEFVAADGVYEIPAFDSSLTAD